MGVDGQRPAPAILPPPPEKTRYQLYQTVNGLQGQFGQVRKKSRPHRNSIPGPSSP
jgi:hypothetical protein